MRELGYLLVPKESGSSYCNVVKMENNIEGRIEENKDRSLYCFVKGRELLYMFRKKGGRVLKTLTQSDYRSREKNKAEFCELKE